ncbi:uncharacterized protein [Aegilops tauschii subsp. strangulata]|uniref:uncharacterized protein isoform X1 n=1 Tax=Aegilops tauschii subsp. strangulata TaxID=200361 RepID=UPI000989CDC5|nr:uncharacterized protein LOC109774528 isoform X1 [Aegilops tauschii subsp. strangulata]
MGCSLNYSMPTNLMEQITRFGKGKIMFLLTAEIIDYVSENPAPNEPAEDATDEEKQEYNDELKQWTKDNKTARVYILGSLTDSLAAEYESDRTACGIMLRLEQDFGEVSLVKVLSLVNKFLTSKMGDKTVNEHFNKLCVLAEELKTAGYPFQEEVQVMVVLNSLPPSWEQFKISFCHSERTLNMRNLRKHLLMEEDRRLNSGKDKASYQPELHLGEYKNNGNRRNWTKRGGGPDLRDKINYKHDRDQRNYRDERRDRVQHGNNNNNSFHKIDKRNYKCHNCGNTGHFGSECTKKRKPNSERNNFHKDDSRKGNQSPEAGGAISWSSKKQDSVALSSMEAEYIAASEAVKEGVWLKEFLASLVVVESASYPVTIFCDNQAAIKVSKDPKFHSKTKHIEGRYHYIRDVVNRLRTVRLDYLPSVDMVADPLTKPLSQEVFCKHVCNMGLRFWN